MLFSMNTMSSLTYNGQKINQRTDGYVNATQMAAIHGKLIADWTRTKDYKRYVEGISRSMGIPIDALVITKTDGLNEERGTWVHPKLAVKLGRWISVEFELWCDDHIKTLIETGTTSIPTKGPHWLKARQDGKSARRTLTDAVKSYIERHPELSDNARQWLYHNVSDELNMRLFGKKSKALKAFFGLKNGYLLRDRLTEDQLINIHAVEAAAVRLIDVGDIQPIKAVQKVAIECLFEGMYHHCYLEPATPKESQLSLF